MHFKVLLALGIWVLATTAAGAEDDKTSDFYAGKTFTVTVGFSPGGIFDLYARILARHIGPHIPGKPDGDRAESARRRRPPARQCVPAHRAA